MTDKEIFCENIHLCENAMYSLAFSVVRNNSDAEEIISESIYRAYKNFAELRNRKLFKPWILRIVHNTAVETIRKNSKLMLTEEIPEISEESFENQYIKNITVRESVNSLKQPYRTVVVLFYYENLSISEIAQITSTNILAVKQQLSRARKQLREILKEDFSE